MPTGNALKKSQWFNIRGYKVCRVRVRVRYKVCRQHRETGVKEERHCLKTEKERNTKSNEERNRRGNKQSKQIRKQASKERKKQTIETNRQMKISIPVQDFSVSTIHKLCHREVCSQLGEGGGGGGGGEEGCDHRPVVILVNQKMPVGTFKTAPSRNYTRADLDSVKQFAEEECMGQLSEENMNQNVRRFSTAILKRATKKSIPRGLRENYSFFWTPQLEQLWEAVNRGRENMESNPSDQSTAECSKARPEFTREKSLQAKTRKQWYEKIASLNLEKDSSKLWNLA